MIRKKLFLLLSAMGILLACNSNRVYEKHKGGFEKNRWKKSDVVEFKPEITDLEEKYDISIALRHVYGFQLKKLKVNVEIITPSGKKKNKTYKLKVIKNKDEYYSDCAGDYCDLESVVDRNFKFKEKGEYTFRVSQDAKIDPLPNVMKVGLIIDKIEKKEE